MKHFATYLPLLFVVILASCAKDKEASRYNEFARHYLQAQHDYYSTNIFVAEEGLATFRQWLSDPKNPCEPWMNRDSVIFGVDARLFLVKEHLGKAEMAEQLYRESVEARNKYLEHIQSLHLPDQPNPLERITSKEDLRDYLARQDKRRDVGWLKNSEKIPK